MGAMARCLNVIHLIGNLTRDPELRYTSSGTPVCVFRLATNRSWKTEDGNRKEESSYHRIVAWKQLAEQCAQLLVKGRKVYVQGRLGYRTYQKDDEEREVAEVVIDDMVLLDAKPAAMPAAKGSTPDDASIPSASAAAADGEPSGTQHSSSPATYPAETLADEIPF